MSISFLDNNSLILLIDNVLLHNINIDKEKDSIYIALGFKNKRKAIVKYLIELNYNYATLIILISSFKNVKESIDLYNEKELLLIFENNNLKNLFIKLINIINGLPNNLLFLGFVNFTTKNDDSLNTVNSNAKVILNYINKFLNNNNKLKEIIICDLNRYSMNLIKINSSSFDDNALDNSISNIELLIKENILIKYQFIEIIIPTCISISRVLHLRTEYLLEINKTHYIIYRYVLSIINSLILNSELKLQCLNINKSLDILIKPLYVIKDYKLYDLLNKSSVINTYNDIVFVTFNLSLNKINIHNDCNNKYSIEDNILDHYITNICNETSYSKSNLLSNTVEKFIINIDSNIYISMFSCIDISLKELNLILKNKIIEYIDSRLLSTLKEVNLDIFKSNVMQLELQNYCYIRLNDKFNIEINMDTTTFKIEEYIEVFSNDAYISSKPKFNKFYNFKV